RSQVGNESIVAAHQLIKLPTGRSILIFKTVRLARLHWSERAENYLFVNRCQAFAIARKKPGNLRVTVRDGFRFRRTQGNRDSLPVEAIEALSLHAMAAHRPQRIGQMLLD